jgi:glycosyltransferase involved in cell wall biosynthesis
VGRVDPADVVIVDSLVIGEAARPLLSMSARLILLLHVVPDMSELYVEGGAALRALCRKSRLVVTGERTLNLIKEIVADADLDAVKVEPGVPEGWQAKIRYAERAQRLLGVANYVSGKGIVRLLDVLVELRDLPWTLTLHGNQDLEPSYFAAVARKTEEYGLDDRVELLGPIPHAAVNQKMLQADLLVHFSQYESYSMVTAEAIACGLPTLSYRTGNSDVFVRSGLVRYLDGTDASEAVALGALIDDESMYGQLRPVGRPEMRTWQDVGRDFLQCLQRR